jgi:aerobic carbon-monoxide dehydrogenase medium subunit
MYDFEFIRAKTVDEAVKALDADEEAMALSGGQTLLPTMKQRLASPTTLVSLAAIPELRGVALDDEGRLVVKAATPHAVVATEAAQALSRARRARGSDRRPGGAVAGHHRRQPRQQRSLGLLPGRSARVERSHPHERSRHRLRRLLPGHVRDRPRTGRNHHRGRFPDPGRRGLREVPQPASRFALVGVFVARFFDGCAWRSPARPASGVYRWTEAEEALAATSLPPRSTRSRRRLRP